MGKAPLVSVLMSVYNSERYITQAVESILNQTFQNFEFIIIDDGSIDKSLSILKHYESRDQRIHLTSRENRGIPKTRNELLAKATGEFVAVMDSDDVALPNRLAHQVDFLHQHPDVLWVGGAFQLIDAQGRYLTCIELAQTNDDIQRLLLDGHVSFLHPTAMIRRSAMVQLGGYDESLPIAEDLDLWLKLSELGQLANLKQPVVQYRLHPDSICDRHQGRPPVEVQTAFERAWKRRGITTPIQVSTSCGWRPSGEPGSRHEFMLKYGWWGFNNRQRETARHYGIRAIATNPFDVEGWKLLACAIAKPLPPSNQV